VLNRTFAAMFVMALLVACSAKSVDLQPAFESASPSTQYDSLLARLDSGYEVDFQALRFAYSESPQYSPYDRTVRELRDSAFVALEAGEPQKALQFSKVILETNYVYPSAHLASMLAYEVLGDSARAAYHQYVAWGLVESIAQSGSGRSTDEALVVIAVDEEFAYLASRGLQRMSQSLLKVGGVPYDHLVVKPADADTSFSLYFDISRPWRWLEAKVKDPESEK